LKNHRQRLEKKITENPKKQNPEHREQFVRLLVRNDRAIRAWLRSLLPTLDDVDEVMQEVSVVAWRKFDQLDDPENFRRWACVIARYEVLMYRRKKARDRIVLGQEVEKLIADEGLEELDRSFPKNEKTSCFVFTPTGSRSKRWPFNWAKRQMLSIRRLVVLALTFTNA